MLTLLAQSNEVANQGLTLLERVNAGGVPLLSLVIAALLGVVAWKFYTEKAALEREYREKAEKLLREQLDSMSKSTAASAKTNQVLEIFQKDAEALKDRITALESQVRDMKTELQVSRRRD